MLSKLEKYGKREPWPDYVQTQSARMLDKCRQMALNLADGCRSRSAQMGNRHDGRRAVRA